MKSTDQCPSSHKEGKASKSELAAVKRELPSVAGSASGLRVWRGPEELSDTPQFRDWLEREFPQGASELDTATGEGEETRRHFLKIMGAGFALAGAAAMSGCRRPDHKILPYAAKVPEEVIPGKALYYATAMPLPGGGAEGLLVETHEGRPTKVEGNPMHPMNRGKSTVWSQASVLGLYDPDRLKFPVLRRGPGDDRIATWDDFRDWAKGHFAKFDRSRGKGLAVLVQKKTSPSRDAMRDRLMTRFPEAKFVAYESIDNQAAAEGTGLAFGAPMRELLTFSAGGQVAAKVVVSLDRDFLDQSDPANLSNNREFAATRRPIGVKDAMSRLYVAEASYTITGAAADHRLRVAPSRIPALAVLLARAVMSKISAPAEASSLKAAIDAVAVPEGADLSKDWIEAVADDLVAEAIEGGKRNRVGETLVLAGASQPPAVHALCHALNAALGNIGKTIRYLPMSAELASSSADGIAEIARGIDAGDVTTLVCIETNPVYDAPAELEFAKKFARSGLTTVTLSVESTETAAASTWSLNGAHYLEAWGDVESWDGTISAIQPMIAPVFEPALSDIEFLALVADPNAAIVAGAKPAEGKAEAKTEAKAESESKPVAGPKIARVDDGHEIVRSVWRARLKKDGAEFDKLWRRALHDGVLAGATPAPQSPKVNFAAVAGGVSRLALSGVPGATDLDVQFITHHVHDGRFANNGWLHELPHVGTRIVWDNPALVSPATAKALDLLPKAWTDKDPSNIYTKQYPEGRVARLTLGGRSIEVAVWVLPGMADGTVLLPLGFGRESSGRVGDGVGFNVNPVRDAASRVVARGAKMERLNQNYMIASTQTHWSVEGRTSIVRMVDLPAWQKFGDEKPVSEQDRLYWTEKTLPFAERVGHSELTHTPPNISIYKNPYKQSDDPYTKAKEAPAGHDVLDGKREEPSPGSRYTKGPQWGMSIDLSTCTGCGACTIACQAENNIPIVGKKEVAKGRELAWIRVDRYFVSDFAHQEFEDASTPMGMLHQPVACVHCENAPCEVVCPVNATVHGPEGHNYMVYNRCIGTRYCANNCPYKVRRFNFFDYGVAKFNGDYVGKDLVNDVMPNRGGVTGSGAHNKFNVNLVPPRLRAKLDEIEKMQKNPDVTVRSRGVMEKCTYCIQRTNEAKIEMKLHDLTKGLPSIPDGFVQSACQQACPTGSIQFGDILDVTSNGGKGSAVKQMREHHRSYMLLAYLNTRPRTTHMVRVMNPNPKLRKPVEDPFGSHSDGHGGGHGESHEGGAHGAEKSGEKHGLLPADPSRSTFIRDGAKKFADAGYALSLKVLGV
jgi:molybdopterin-containing oxidoreductase family iron-sulfur binding subunit